MLIVEWLKNQFGDPTPDNLGRRNIKNWRCAVELPEQQHYLSVCIEGSIITIDNKSLSDWVRYDIYHFDTEKEIIIRCKMYDGLPLCSTCFGSGKLDWARQAKNKPTKIEGITIHDPDYIKFVPSNRVIYSACGTKAQCLPNLYEGEKYCYKCGASGMMFNSYHELFPDKLWYEAKFPVMGG
jgi:hypothetical protein